MACRVLSLLDQIKSHHWREELRLENRHFCLHCLELLLLLISIIITVIDFVHLYLRCHHSWIELHQVIHQFLIRHQR